MIKGIVRQIDKQGRVVIPIGFRKRLKIEDLDEVEIYPCKPDIFKITYDEVKNEEDL